MGFRTTHEYERFIRLTSGDPSKGHNRRWAAMRHVLGWGVDG